MLLLLFILFAVPAFSQADIIADYEGGEELIMTTKFIIDSKDYKYNQKSYPNTVPQYSIYWNPATTNYYYVKDGSRLTKTNGIAYELNPDKAEQVFAEEIRDPDLQYAGYISPTERLYIDRRDNQQYIKILIPINDPFRVIPRKHLSSDGTYFMTIYENPVHKKGFPRNRFTGEIDL